MLNKPRYSYTRARQIVVMRRLFRDTILPACFPGLSLLAFWIGGEELLLTAALAMPLLYLIMTGLDHARAQHTPRLDDMTGLVAEEEFQKLLGRAMTDARRNNTATACFLIELESYPKILERFGETAADAVLQETARRLQKVMRDGDTVARVNEARFAVANAPVRPMDVETCIQLATRLQAATEEPVRVDQATLYPDCSVGFCQSTSEGEKSPHALIEAASLALQEACRAGSSSIRAYSKDMRQSALSRYKREEEACMALERGQITAWFQPQISTDTGAVTGFEALARWDHPAMGLVPPGEFLPVLEQNGQMERLGELMMRQALAALRAWDEAGYQVPRVGINFSADELRNPVLIERMRWEIDHFDLEPNRIAVEVLETVVATSDNDIVTRNINGLAKLGCGIDLDDFGTGHAAISSVRRFAVSRIKIDRSFVSSIDNDQDQQRMFAAIQTMAERLGLETLAEGVETAGEHAMLSQLGCAHVQGFGIGRPMPFTDTFSWMDTHFDRIGGPPHIGRRTG